MFVLKENVVNIKSTFKIKANVNFKSRQIKISSGQIKF